MTTEPDGLTLLEVVLTEKARRALENAGTVTGDSRNATVNHALIMYDAIAFGSDFGMEVLGHKLRPGDEHWTPIVLLAGLRRLQIRLRIAYFVAWAALFAVLVVTMLWVTR